MKVRLSVGMLLVSTLPVFLMGADGPWERQPTVTVSGAEKDARLRGVRDAVAFWNHALAEIGTPFRFGTVKYVTEEIPAEYLRSLSARIVRRGAYPEFPEVIAKLPGDVIVALSAGNFVSFTITSRDGTKVLIAIKSDQVFPLNLPNVARNTIAHELGHAIGLDHNSDKTKLMCGRPADCRPDMFNEPKDRFFPLTAEEKAQILRMYPKTWKPRKTNG